MRHRACQNCGKYRGHQVVDVVARTERNQARSKRKELGLRESGKSTGPAEEAAKEEKPTKAAKATK